ncbi:MAG: CHASE2 domain-containing protein, partial [Candidatus Neomarinimicrobiota bacterium]
MKAVLLGKLFKPAGRIIALAITAGMLGLFAYNAATLEPSFLNLMDKKWVDFIIKERGAQPHSGRVVIAAVDTLSVDRYGRWPWPRARMAELVEALTDHYEVRTIGFDIVFSEPEPDPGGDLIESVKDRFNSLGFEPSAKADRFLQFLEGTKAGVHGDARFAGALAEAANSVLGYFFFSRRGSVIHLSQAEITTAKASLAGLEISDIKGPVDRGTVPIGLLPEPNIEAIGEAALSAGFFNIIPDREDGVIRRVHLLMQFGDNVYPALGLQVFRQYLGAEAIAIETDQSGFIRTI